MLLCGEIIDHGPHVRHRSWMYLVGGLMVGGIKSVEAVFLLLLVFVAMFAGLARRLKCDCGIVVELSPGDATDWARS